MCGSFIVADRSKKRKCMRRQILPEQNAVFLRRPFSNSIRPEISFIIGAAVGKVMSGRIPITASPSTTKVTFGLVATAGGRRRVLLRPAHEAREELQQPHLVGKRPRARLPTR